MSFLQCIFTFSRLSNQWNSIIAKSSVQIWMSARIYQKHQIATSLSITSDSRWQVSNLPFVSSNQDLYVKCQLTMIYFSKCLENISHKMFLRNRMIKMVHFRIYLDYQPHILAYKHFPMSIKYFKFNPCKLVKQRAFFCQTGP